MHNLTSVVSQVNETEQAPASSRSREWSGPVLFRRSSSTLVLNAISHHRQQLIQEYGNFTPPKQRPRRKRNKTQLNRQFRTYNKLKIGFPLDSGEISHIIFHRNACSVHRFVKNIIVSHDSPGRGRIDSFSDKSRARLKLVAGNCYPLLVSQFLCTYEPENKPSDGVLAKKHLDRFLTAVRRKYSGSVYLWVLEFQNGKVNKGVPHFHIYFSFPPSPEKHLWLAETWNRVTGGSEKHLSVHLHSRNFVRWDMKKGGYLTKYLEKSEQKQVPSHYSNVGRFWGCSRGLVPDGEVIVFDELVGKSVDHIDKITGEVLSVRLSELLYRSLRKHHEATLRSCGIRRKSRITKRHLAKINLPSGGAVIRHLLLWYDRETSRGAGVAPF